MQLLISQITSIASHSSAVLEIIKVLAVSTVWVGALAFIVWKREQKRARPV